MWIAQISYFIAVTARIAAPVSSQHLWFLSSWKGLHTEKVIYVYWVMCKMIHLGLYDMNCYSVNGSHASQGGIPVKRMSQIKKSVFPLCSCGPHLAISLLSLPSFLPIRHPVLGKQLLSTQKGGSYAWGRSACSLSWHGKQGLLWTWRSCTYVWLVDCLSVRG